MIEFVKILLVHVYHWYFTQVSHRNKKEFSGSYSGIKDIPPCHRMKHITLMYTYKYKETVDQ